MTDHTEQAAIVAHCIAYADQQPDQVIDVHDIDLLRHLMLSGHIAPSDLTRLPVILAAADTGFAFPIQFERDGRTVFRRPPEFMGDAVIAIGYDDDEHMIEIVTVKDWVMLGGERYWRYTSYDVEWCRRDGCFYADEVGSSPHAPTHLDARRAWAAPSLVIEDLEVRLALPVGPELDSDPFALVYEDRTYYCRRCDDRLPYGAPCAHTWKCPVCGDMTRPGERCDHWHLRQQMRYADRLVYEAASARAHVERIAYLRREYPTDPFWQAGKSASELEALAAHKERRRDARLPILAAGIWRARAALDVDDFARLSED